MTNYDDELINEIVDTINIEDLIGEYVDLTPRGSKYFFGECPFHDEDTASFCVTPGRKMYHCFGCGASGNVIRFVQQYKGIGYKDAIEYCAAYAGISTDEKIETSSSVKLFKKINRKQKQVSRKEIYHKPVNPDRLKKFKRGNIKQWQDEGIPQEIMDMYGVAYDARAKRIVYPVYDIDGNLINIKGRTIIPNYKEYQPPIPKYMNYEEIGELDYFQGLNFKKEIVKQKKEVIIFESFKSVMKADSYGYDNSISMENHTLNRYQLKILVGLSCDVVFAFDKDVTLDEIKKNKYVQSLMYYVNVYVVLDKDNLLGKKDSPVDRGKEVWENLYKNKIKL